MKLSGTVHHYFRKFLVTGHIKLQGERLLSLKFFSSSRSSALGQEAVLPPSSLPQRFIQVRS